MRAHVHPVLLLAALVAVGCGGGTFSRVSNGGAGPLLGSCELPAIRATSSGVEIEPVATSPCAGDRVGVPVGATFAMWQTVAASSLVGHVVSPAASAEIAWLTSGGDASGLGGASDDARLTSGGSGAVLTSGGSSEGATSGSGALTLTSGGGAEAISSGAGGAALTSGGAEAALTAGGDSVQAIRVEKRFSQTRLVEGHDGTFVLTLVNGSLDDLRRFVVVDRVPAVLRVTDAGPARAHELPDGTTLVVWDDARLPHGHRRSLTVRVRPRARLISE